jgi:hypothetical protein
MKRLALAVSLLILAAPVHAAWWGKIIHYIINPYVINR